MFLDWGLALEHGRDPWRCRCSGTGRCAARSACSRARGIRAPTRWVRLASRLEATLRERAWLPRHGRWAGLPRRPAVEAPGDVCELPRRAGRHARRQVPPGVRDAVRVGASGTPFMTAFRLRALLARGRVGSRARPGASHLGGHARPRPGHLLGGEPRSRATRSRCTGARSVGVVCHAWAAGPAAILPEAVLGLRPIDDGWARFEVRPELGDLEWAAAVVPAPIGDIVVVADRARVSVQVPSGAVLVREGHAVPGPATVEWARSPSAVVGGGARDSPQPGHDSHDSSGCPGSDPAAGSWTLRRQRARAEAPGEAADGSKCPGRRGGGIRLGGHGLERAEPPREGGAGHGGARAGRDRRARVRRNERRGSCAPGGAAASGSWCSTCGTRSSPRSHGERRIGPLRTA